MIPAEIANTHIAVAACAASGVCVPAGAGAPG